MTTKAPEHGLDSLVLDLLEWIGRQERTYAQTMDVWRTSCPRLTVWEEAVDRGLVVRVPHPEGGVRIALTAAGGDFLKENRGVPPPG
jgi:hypothetical protein